MADLPGDFWSGWIAVITVVTLIALAWLVWSVYFSADAQAAEIGNEVWDETLREGSTPAPLWWFWLIVALLAASVVYLMLYPGLGSYRGALGWSQAGAVAASAERYEETFGEQRAAIAAADPAALAGSPLARRAAASVFKNHCAACHGEDARGQAQLFPDLRDASWQWGGGAAEIQQTITQGRQAVMPSWQAALGDDGVEQVTDYVRSLAAGGAATAAAGAAEPTEGARLFQLYCTACHGPDGSGLAALGAPALNDDVWLYGGSREAIRQSIANGRSGQMPAFGARLDAAQIKLLTAWLADNAE